MITMRAEIVILALILTGCAEDTGRFHPTMESDPPQVGAEAILYQNRLEEAYVKSHSTVCQYTDINYQSKDSYTYRRYHRKADGKNPKESAKRDFSCMKLADGASQEQVRGFAQAGFALSDLYCRTFFRRLALRSNIRRFDHSVVNGVGTLASAIMGLASAGSAATGAVGAGFGTADSIFSNYDATFVVQPDPSLLEEDVIRQQQGAETAFMSGLSSTSTYYDANKAIERHAYFCTFYGMKAIINSNLQKDASTAAATIKSKIDSAALATLSRGLAVYAKSLTDKKAKSAFLPKEAEILGKVAVYLGTAKADAKIDAQIDSLSTILSNYKTETKADIDKQIDATIAVLASA